MEGDESAPINVWIDMANRHAREGQIALALTCCRRILCPTFSPNHAEALILATKLCCYSCVWAEEGCQYGERALKQPIDLNQRAQLCKWLGICLVQQLTVRSKESKQQLALKAQKHLDEALDISGPLPEATLPLAVLYAVTGEVKKSLGLVKDVMEATSHPQPDFWILSVLLLTCVREWDKASELCDVALGSLRGSETESSKRGMKDMLKIRAKLSFLSGQFQNALSVHRRRLKTTEEAIGDQTDTEEAQIWQDLAELYSSSAVSKWEDAKECARRALELSPELPSSWECAGVVEERQGNRTKALQHFRTALALDPDHVGSNVQLGNLLSVGDNSCPALSKYHLQKALEIEESRHDAWETLGRIFLEEGNTDKANECLISEKKWKESCPVLPFSSFQWGYFD